MGKKKERGTEKGHIKVKVKTNVRPKAKEKERFLKSIEDLRAMIRSGTHAACPCVQMKCEWHGRCYECVMIHRVLKNHVPECLQTMFYEKMEQLARGLEMKLSVERTSTDAFWDYVNKVSPPKR